MKIITESAAYVQKNDIAYLNQTDLPIPASIFIKVFGNGITIINDSNRYEFVKFEDPSEIEFFKSIDWMIDYNLVKDLSDDEILDMGQSIAQTKNHIAEQFNAMSNDDKKKNMDMVSQCELLDFKMYSLRDFFWYKNGQLKMTLPEDIDYQTESIQEEKGIQKIIKKIFPKKNK